MAAQKLRALHERAGLRVGRPWFPRRANRGNSYPFCADGGNVALRARIGYTGRARPPPWGGRSPPYPPAGGGSARGALWFLARRGYLHPGPNHPHLLTRPARRQI
jgi:hypothetical protein